MERIWYRESSGADFVTTFAPLHPDATVAKATTHIARLTQDLMACLLTSRLQNS
jgi:hypothetical protein